MIQNSNNDLLRHLFNRFRPSVASVCPSVFPLACRHIYVGLSVSLSVGLSVSLSVCLSVYPLVCPSVYPSVLRSECQPSDPSTLGPLVCLFINFSDHRSVRLYVSLLASQTIVLSLHRTALQSDGVSQTIQCSSPHLTKTLVILR